MRRLISILAAIYVIGIAVQMWPLIETQWDSVPASHLAAGVADRLPVAAAWPARAWERTHAFFTTQAKIASR